MSISKYHVSKNLYNAVDTSWTDGYLDNNGQPVSSTISHYTTNFTEVEANTTYTWSGTITESSSSSNNVYYYDGSKNWISKANAGVVSPRTFTTPSDCKYIRFQVTRGVSSTNDWMLNKGQTALPYEPYGDSFKDWFYREYGTETETFTTLPKTIIGDGQNISAYTIKGNMSQSGTPTPSNPIYPTEVGDKTANLYDSAATNIGYWISSTGAITSPPNATYGAITNKIKVDVEQYTIWYYGTRPYSYSICWYDNTDTFISRSHYSYTEMAQPSVVSVPNNAASFIFQVSNGSNTGTDVITTDIISSFKIMLNTGSTALPYEPYGYKIPILSNGVAYPVYLAEPLRKIGDSVDTALSTGTATRYIYKHELTGQETWTRTSVGKMYSSNALNGTPNYLHTLSVVTMACSHYKADINYGNTQHLSLNEICLYGTIGSSPIKEIYIYPDGYATAEDYATYLQQQYANGTPVTIWFIMETPTTESFTAPIIPTSGTAQSFDVDTTLKPSEVSLTYHGWHEHSDTKFTTP